MYCTIIPQSDIYSIHQGFANSNASRFLVDNVNEETHVSKMRNDKDCATHAPSNRSSHSQLQRMAAMGECRPNAADQEKPKIKILCENSWQLNWTNFIHSADEIRHISGLKLAQACNLHSITVLLWEKSILVSTSQHQEKVSLFWREG